jgi:protein-L-isoaspartate(D-aspartate) O-methyltransferase
MLHPKLHAKVRADEYIHQGKRQLLIDQIAQKGITDKAVLDAMMEVPRHFFLDPAFEVIAYENRAFPILAAQTISHPYTVAYQTQLLEVKKHDKILEIGTGSAYQSCVLAKMGARVFTIERQKILYNYNTEFFYLKEFPEIKRFLGDGFKGLPGFMPFDKIIVTCGAPFIPETLLQQLKMGGIMVVPVGEGDTQIMHKIIKTENGFIEDKLDNFSFVPMLEGINRK